MPAPRGLVQRLDQELHRSGLLPRGDALLVAVSGGADSVALLRVLCEINRSDYWGWELVVGHVDHGLRGKESAGDARFVKGLAKELGLGFAGAKLRLKGHSGEDAARQGRLKALGKMAGARGCAGVVMAHHADDQAETVLMRMFRGCGIAGLASMAAEKFLEKSGPDGLSIRRPLLGVRRGELREYLLGIGQAWREDGTNNSPRFLRNRVRGEILPVVEGIWPGAVGALGRLAETAQLTERAMAVFAGRAELRPEFSGDLRRGRAVSVSREAMRGQPPAVVIYFLRAVIQELGGTTEIADHERLMEAARAVFKNAGGVRIQMGRGITISVEGKMVKIAQERRRERRRLA